MSVWTGKAAFTAEVIHLGPQKLNEHSAHSRLKHCISITSDLILEISDPAHDQNTGNTFVHVVFFINTKSLKGAGSVTGTISASGIG